MCDIKERTYSKIVQRATLDDNGKTIIEIDVEVDRKTPMKHQYRRFTMKLNVDKLVEMGIVELKGDFYNEIKGDIDLCKD